MNLPPLEPWSAALLALAVLVAALTALSLLTSERRFDVRDRVFLITGGSSGIGKATAQLLLQKGANVALIARRESVLQDAAAELRSSCPSPGQRITTHAADVGDEASAAAAVAAAAAAHGGFLDGLVNSAGVSGPKRFEEATAADFESTFRINVVGTRNVIAAALPFMARVPASASAGDPAHKGAHAAASPSTGAPGSVSSPAAPAAARARPSSGRVVLVSSQAGQTGLYGYTAYSVSGVEMGLYGYTAYSVSGVQTVLYGYTAYSASKFALRGLFEALSQELHTRRIRVSLAFPPDTDTPMLAEENKSKPALTRLLSESSATVQPQAVAAAIVAGMVSWAPFISVGFDGWMLSTLTAGMAPAGNVWAGVVQVATVGLWRAVGLAYTQYFFSVISRNDGRAVEPSSAATKEMPLLQQPAAGSASGRRAHVPSARHADRDGASENEQHPAAASSGKGHISGRRRGSGGGPAARK